MKTKNKRKNKKIKSKCSNCGKWNKYSRKEWKGRELTICIYCGHPLSICSFFPPITPETINENLDNN